jgi:predicted ATP-grasp superfamily ATP-dependent carboligase
MNTLFFVFCIVAVAVAGDTIKKIYKTRLDRDKLGKSAELSNEKLDALEERIRVLERIVTEDKRDLKREINSL